ncbi:MAG: hypothetical protein ACRCVI_01115 [Mycoplasmoidaceae bacterium]
MNKKIKWCGIGTLFLGSIIATTLPIVSCSANGNSSKTELTIKVGDALDLGLVGSSFAKIANPIFNNNSALTKDHFNTIMTTTYNVKNTPGVWSALGFYYEITKTGTTEVEKVQFSQAVDGIAISGAYPTSDGSETDPIDIKLTIYVNLKNTFTTKDTAVLKFETKIGVLPA